MIYKKIFIVVIMLFGVCFAEKFGEYKYSKYMAIQQQIQNQQAAARILQARNYQNPTRNIRYPDSYNKYPNIQRTQYGYISPSQRYSPAYYQRMYR